MAWWPVTDRSATTRVRTARISGGGLSRGSETLTETGPLERQCIAVGVCDISAHRKPMTCVTGLGAMNVTKPCKFMWFGDRHGPKPYTNTGDPFKPPKKHSLKLTCIFRFPGGDAGPQAPPSRDPQGGPGGRQPTPAGKLRYKRVATGMSRAIDSWTVQMEHLQGGLHVSCVGLQARYNRDAPDMQGPVSPRYPLRALRPLSRQPSAAC